MSLFYFLACFSGKMDLSIALCDEFPMGVKAFDCHDELWPALNVDAGEQAIEAQAESDFSINRFTKSRHSLHVLYKFSHTLDSGF